MVFFSFLGNNIIWLKIAGGNYMENLVKLVEQHSLGQSYFLSTCARGLAVILSVYCLSRSDFGDYLPLI